MAHTFITTDLTTAQTLAADGDRITVSRDGSILTGGVSAIQTATGVTDTHVQVFGELISQNYPIRLTGTTDDTKSGIGGHDLFIGSSAVVSSTLGAQGPVLVYGRANTITNFGELVGHISTINYQGNDGEIVNHGVITASQGLGIFVAGQTGFSTTTDIVNTGLISGQSGIRATNETLRLVNSGTIVSTDTGFDYTIWQSTAGRRLFIENTGIIQSAAGNAIAGNSGSDVITNHGQIQGDVSLGSGVNTLTNAGDILGEVRMGNLVDTIANSGVIEDDVWLYEGDDTYDGRDGIVRGEVLGGLGNDVYFLSDGRTELVEELAEGVDTVRFEGQSYGLGENFENLILIGAADSKGFGNDMANMLDGNSGDNRLVGGAGGDIIGGDRGNDVLLGQNGSDDISGGFGDDTLRGGDGNDTMSGNKGNDVLRGGNDDDNLTGGRGDDTLDGGRGKDILEGGLGADRFVFSAPGHSTNDSQADVIADFESGMDLIDLSSLSGMLDFIGSGGFSGSAPELRVATSGGNSIVRIDADGDGTADMKIFVNGVTDLDAFDFLL